MSIPCELAFSAKSNFMEALNMVGMEMSQHHISRSLVDTGHALHILTCGIGHYHVDEGLYKMAKYSLLLNNIYAQIISFRKKPDTLAPRFTFGTSYHRYHRHSKKQKDLISHAEIYNKLAYFCIE